MPAEYYDPETSTPLSPPASPPATSILHFHEGYGSDKTLSGRGFVSVIEHLREQGIDPVVTRGTTEYDLESKLVIPDRIQVREEDGGMRITTTRAEEPIPFGETSIRAYSSLPLPVAVEQAGANVINTAKVRELDEKLTAFRVFEEHQPRTLVAEPDRLLAQLPDIRTAKVVLKPTHAADSRGRLIVDKSDLLDSGLFQIVREGDDWHLHGNTDPPVNLNLSETYLLQEFIDTHQPFPPDLHVLESCMPFYEAHRDDRKEVRLMVYWDASRPDKQSIIPFARIFSRTKPGAGVKQNENDQFLLIDIEHALPPDLDQLARSVVNTTLEYGQATYLHGGVDCAYDGHRWYLMEVNLWQPVPVSYKLAREHGAEPLAEIHRSSIATLLADSAHDAQANAVQRSLPPTNTENSP